MQISHALGTFLVLALPDHRDAVEVRSASRDELAALCRAVLPDMQIENHADGARAVVAHDEWVHALDLLTRQL